MADSAGAPVASLQLVKPRSMFLCGSLPVWLDREFTTLEFSPGISRSFFSDRTPSIPKVIPPVRPSLDTRPPSWLHRDNILMPVDRPSDSAGSTWGGSYLHHTAARKCEALAVRGLADFGEDAVDVIAPAEVLKQLFKLPFSKSSLFVSVHRVGRTLVLNPGSEPGGVESHKVTQSSRVQREAVLLSKLVAPELHGHQGGPSSDRHGRGIGISSTTVISASSVSGDGDSGSNTSGGSSGSSSGGRPRGGLPTWAPSASTNAPDFVGDTEGVVRVCEHRQHRHQEQHQHQQQQQQQQQLQSVVGGGDSSTLENVGSTFESGDSLGSLSLLTTCGSGLGKQIQVAEEPGEEQEEEHPQGEVSGKGKTSSNHGRNLEGGSRGGVGKRMEAGGGGRGGGGGGGVGVEAETGPDGFARVVFWQFEHLRLFLGSDLILFSNEKHAAVSLHLVEVELESSPLVWLDIWLDNLMAGVPELAICYHHKGVVQGYELLHADDVFLLKCLARDGSSSFFPHAVRDSALAILRFLQDKCVHSPGTYWLRKDAGTDVLQLFDLTPPLQHPSAPIRLAPSLSSPPSATTSHVSMTAGMHASRSNPKPLGVPPSCTDGLGEGNSPSPSTLDATVATHLSLPLTMLLYRLAMRLSDSHVARDRHRTAQLFGYCLQLLHQKDHPGLRATAHEYMARFFLQIPQDELPSLLQPSRLHSSLLQPPVPHASLLEPPVPHSSARLFPPLQPAMPSPSRLPLPIAISFPGASSPFSKGFISLPCPAITATEAADAADAAADASDAAADAADAANASATNQPVSANADAQQLAIIPRDDQPLAVIPKPNHCLAVAPAPAKSMLLAPSAPLATDTGAEPRPAYEAGELVKQRVEAVSASELEPAVEAEVEAEVEAQPAATASGPRGPPPPPQLLPAVGDAESTVSSAPAAAAAAPLPLAPAAPATPATPAAPAAPAAEAAATAGSAVASLSTPHASPGARDAESTVAQAAAEPHAAAAAAPPPPPPPAVGDAESTVPQAAAEPAPPLPPPPTPGDAESTVAQAAAAAPPSPPPPPAVGEAESTVAVRLAAVWHATQAIGTLRWQRHLLTHTPESLMNPPLALLHSLRAYSASGRCLCGESSCLPDVHAGGDRESGVYGGRKGENAGVQKGGVGGYVSFKGNGGEGEERRSRGKGRRGYRGKGRQRQRRLQERTRVGEDGEEGEEEGRDEDARSSCSLGSSCSSIGAASAASAASAGSAAAAGVTSGSAVTSDSAVTSSSAVTDRRICKLIALLGEAYLGLAESYKGEGQVGRALRAAELACVVVGGWPWDLEDLEWGAGGEGGEDGGEEDGGKGRFRGLKGWGVGGEGSGGKAGGTGNSGESRLETACEARCESTQNTSSLETACEAQEGGRGAKGGKKKAKGKNRKGKNGEGASGGASSANHIVREAAKETRVEDRLRISDPACVPSNAPMLRTVTKGLAAASRTVTPRTVTKGISGAKSKASGKNGQPGHRDRRGVPGAKPGETRGVGVSRGAAAGAAGGAAGGGWQEESRQGGSLACGCAGMCLGGAFGASCGRWWAICTCSWRRGWGWGLRRRGMRGLVIRSTATGLVIRSKGGGLGRGEVNRAVWQRGQQQWQQKGRRQEAVS
ncbi:hypothetical protein CLOM_g24250 [Closterium sp. NIES-68]|nr:hypothetical protein CLOM_g24250 [Closterium sp. NIES-68]